MQYFTIDELCASETARKKGIQNKPTDDVVSSLTRLAEQVLDPLRRKFGKPIYINSGYRCYALNREVGGSATSQHLKGEAADITAGTREENKRLFQLIRESGRFDQLIDESDFAWVHVSFMASGNRKQVLHL